LVISLSLSVGRAVVLALTLANSGRVQSLRLCNDAVLDFFPALCGGAPITLSAGCSLAWRFARRSDSCAFG